MKLYLHILAGFLLLTCCGVQASAEVQQPVRAFGYVIGDVLEQRILLQVDGKPVEVTELPPLQRVGAWLQRRTAQLIHDSQQRSWLVLRYQVINAPLEPIVISLPAMILELNQQARLKVEDWPIGITPLTPVDPKQRELLPTMRPDRAPAIPDAGLASRRLKQSALLLSLGLLAWMGWWLWRRQADLRRLPFARAFHDLRKLDHKQLDENLEAWLILHRAFNGAAGRSIHRSAVADLLHRQPWLASLQTNIEAFYSASATRFFEQSEQPQSFALADFCKHLYLAEKRHAGTARRSAG